MDKHISSMRDAHESYKDAWATVLAEFSAATGQYNNDLAMDMAIQVLHNHIERFILTCEKMRADMKSPSIITAHIDEIFSFLVENHHRFQDHLTEVLAQNINDLGFQNLNNQLDNLLVAFEYFRMLIEMEAKVALNTLDPNATEVALISPDNAQRRVTESDTKHVDEAEVLQALVEFDLYWAEETMEQKRTAYAMQEARQKYKDAMWAVIAEFDPAAGHHNNDLAIKSAMQNLDEHYEGYLLASKNLRDFAERKLRELEVMHRNFSTAVSEDMAVLDINRPEPEETVEHKTAASQMGMCLKEKEGLKSEAQYGGVSEEHGMSDLDLSRLALEEAVEQHTAALPVLPAPDQNNNALEQGLN